MKFVPPKFKNTTIMLDCSLGQSSVLSFTPKILLAAEPSLKKRKLSESDLFQIGSQIYINDYSARFQVPQFPLCDVSSINIILISSYHNMLALPYLTEKLGFKGQIYATEPTLQIGRQLMIELVKYWEQLDQLPNSPSITETKSWNSAINTHFETSEFGELKRQLPDAPNWQSLYTLQEIESSIRKIRGVSYSEHIDVFDSIQIVPSSSGFSIGSANWVIRTEQQKVSYVARSSLSPLHATHLDLTLHHNSDLMILADITEPQAHQRQPESQINELCNVVGTTLTTGGSVLIPHSPAGLIFEIIDAVVDYLAGVGLRHVPLYIVNPVSETLFAYTNIIAEWLSKKRQDKAYLPEPPFAHSMYLKNGRLKNFASISDPTFTSVFRSPCVVFTGHPSLRFGDATALLNAWKKDPKNTLIITVRNGLDAEYDIKRLLTIYEPIKMKIHNIPIDRRLRTGPELDKMLKALAPKQLIVSEEQYHRINTPNCAVIPCKQFMATKLKLSRPFESCNITPQLAKIISPLSLGLKSVAHFSALLSLSNGAYTLHSSEFSSFNHTSIENPPIWGAPNWKRVFAAIQQLEGVQAESISYPTYIEVAFRVGKEIGFLQFHETKTIILVTNPEIRNRLKDLILEECDYHHQYILGKEV